MQSVMIKSLPITLAQFLKWSGVALTGGQAKELIHAGEVRLNGGVCQVVGQKLQPGDIVGVDDQEFKVVLA